MINDIRKRKDSRVSKIYCNECGKESLLPNCTLRHRKNYTCSRECLYNMRYKAKHIYYDQGLKKCSKCNEHKPLEEFNAENKVGSLDKRTARCKDCSSTHRRKRSTGETKEVNLKRYYGLTTEQFDEMILLQDNRCYICGIHAEECKHKTLVVDHCHTTNLVRKLLCSNCNLAIGNFKDSIENMKKGIQYITEHSLNS